MGFLLGNARQGQRVKDGFALDLQFPGQVVDSDFRQMLPSSPYLTEPRRLAFSYPRIIYSVSRDGSPRATALSPEECNGPSGGTSYHISAMQMRLGFHC
jgi:hypothetical protein